MINDLKDLKALFKLCRAQGVTDFKGSGFEIKFGDIPQPQSGSVQIQGEDDMPTDDELLFYSTPQGQDELDKKVGLKS